MTGSIVHPYRHGSAERTVFGYRTADHPRLDRVQNGISAVCGVIAGAAILATTVLTVVEVLSRAIFESPLGWSVSFIEFYLLPATAFFGMVTAYRSGAHVAVGSVFNSLAPARRKILLLAGYLVVLAGMVALGYPGLQATVFSFTTGESPVPGSSELVIPSWVWRAIVPVSMSAGIVIVAIDLLRELLGPWTRPVTDYDPGDRPDQTPGHADETDGASPEYTAASAKEKEAVR
ncbi:TRAP transporter small permease [Gordonia sp. PKS22-38]|uniref:TRAP transporter small permease n=1 Tax=Gordonia prachuapensis TaxID=3115651 RepID=A0ABU7MTK7_9ACTN|nr:TRAP transporter small permease [Gordonia sp. PKS22-38]